MLSLKGAVLYSLLCILYPSIASPQEITLPFQPSADKTTARLGVILPLSGKYSQFGEKALQGILLAAGIFGPDPAVHAANGGKGLNVEIVVRDTRDDPVASAKAVEELIYKDDVSAIIGPLLSITATDAAKVAQKLRVPMVTISQKPGITNVGDYIFRNFLSPSEQAKASAHYALDTLKYKKFAVLYPNSLYGIELANLFKEEVEKGSGEVVAGMQYKEGQTYFGNEIATMFKIKETEKREGRRKIKIFEPTLEVDALYIPDYYDTIGLILPHLAYYNIQNIKLLGSNGWNSPKLISLAGKYVEGAVFVDGFFIDSKREVTVQFTNTFKSIYKTEPDILSAQAFDATRLLMTAIMAAEQKKGEGLRNSLASLKDFNGVTGDISFDANREASKKLFTLTVREGTIVEVEAH